MEDFRRNGEITAPLTAQRRQETAQKRRDGCSQDGQGSVIERTHTVISQKRTFGSHEPATVGWPFLSQDYLPDNASSGIQL
jgi:hypothetical protein